MLFTMMTSLAGYALIVVELMHGGGRHRGDVDPEDYAFGVKINFITQPIYLYAICFVKLSVGATLFRIATTKFYRHLILSVMAFMLFYTIGCFFVSLPPLAPQINIPRNLLRLLLMFSMAKRGGYPYLRFSRPSYYNVPISVSCGIRPSPPSAGIPRSCKGYLIRTLPSTSSPIFSSPSSYPRPCYGTSMSTVEHAYRSWPFWDWASSRVRLPL